MTATDHLDPFARVARNGETATDAAANRASDPAHTTVGIAPPAGIVPAELPPKEQAMPDTHVISPLDDHAPSLAELHRRWCDNEFRARELWAESARRRYAAGADPRFGPLGVALVGQQQPILTAWAAIDAEIDKRLALARSPKHAAAIEQQRGALHAELAEKRALRRQCEDELGITALNREAENLDPDYDAELAVAMEAAPIATIADLAALVDLAFFERRRHPSEPADPSQFSVVRPWTARLVRHLAGLVPGFKFAVVNAIVPDLAPTYASAFDWMTTAPPEGDDDAMEEPETERVAELRRRVAALAAQYREPALPSGDAGLIEAGRRQCALEKQITLLSREFDVGIDEEERLLAPVHDLETEFWEFVRDAIPEGPAGVAAKLRWLDHGGMLTVDAEMEACIAVLDGTLAAACG